jgi:hypothetical protein
MMTAAVLVSELVPWHPGRWLFDWLLVENWRSAEQASTSPAPSPTVDADPTEQADRSEQVDRSEQADRAAKLAVGLAIRPSWELQRDVARPLHRSVNGQRCSRVAAVQAATLERLH